VIVLDTSVLIDGLSGSGSTSALRAAIVEGERIVIPTLVLYEWWRGPRKPQELAAQEALFPRAAAIGFGADEAALAADLYARVSRPRGREIDLAIAACAIARGACLWTLNPRDFEDMPGLQVAAPGTLRRPR
jgi:predicted nucleic acid-binding protein